MNLTLICTTWEDHRVRITSMNLFVWAKYGGMVWHMIWKHWAKMLVKICEKQKSKLRDVFATLSSWKDVSNGICFWRKYNVRSGIYTLIWRVKHSSQVTERAAQKLVVDVLFHGFIIIIKKNATSSKYRGSKKFLDND